MSSMRRPAPASHVPPPWARAHRFSYPSVWPWRSLYHRGRSAPLRDRSAHELIEHGNREGRLSMFRAVYHPFLDQPRPQWPHALADSAHRLSDGARGVGAWPEFGHCSQVVLFTRCQSIKANAEEFLSSSSVALRLAASTSAAVIGECRAVFHACFPHS